MNDQTELSALRRKAGTGRAPTDGVGMTSAKAFRLALSKAAQVVLGLAVRVQSIKEERMNQPKLLDVLDKDALLLMLEGPFDSKGVAVFDTQALAAVIEVQTLGHVMQTKAADRLPTHTDSAMCEAVLDRVLQEFEGHLATSTAADWATGFRFEKRIESVRLLGLALEDVDYRVFHLPLDLADGAKQGTLLIVFPAEGAGAGQLTSGGEKGWTQAMEKAVCASHVDILAVLHRTQVSLATVRAFQPGDLVTVPKSAVSEVSMEGSDGRVVGVARLGQQNGFRALRISDGLAVAARSAASQIVDITPTDGALGTLPDAMDAPQEIDVPPEMGAPIGEVGDAPMPMVDIPMTPMDPIGAQDGDVLLPEPDMPMMPMENAPMGDVDNIPMAAMPMDIEIG